MSFSDPKGATTPAAASLRLSARGIVFLPVPRASLGELELRLADLRVFGTRGTGVAGPGWASLGT